MKIPSSQWYWADWMKDPNVRSVSYAARGLWMDMLSLMHESDRRGYLQINGKPVSTSQLARMTGGDTDEVSRLLQELDDSGVYSCTDDGTIFSRRMIRDERKRKLCSAAGRKGGGNPAFKGHYNGDCKGGDKQESKASSSSSSSNLNSLSDVPENSDEMIEQIAREHPRYELPEETFKALAIEAIPNVQKKLQISPVAALEFLRDRTRLFASYVTQWSDDDKAHCVGSSRWYRSAGYFEREENWKRKIMAGRSGNGKSKTQDRNNSNIVAVTSGAAISNTIRAGSDAGFAKGNAGTITQYADRGSQTLAASFDGSDKSTLHVQHGGNAAHGGKPEIIPPGDGPKSV